jgi:hypothetical protein
MVRVATVLPEEGSLLHPFVETGYVCISLQLGWVQAEDVWIVATKQAAWQR